MSGYADVVLCDHRARRIPASGQASRWRVHQKHVDPGEVEQPRTGDREDDREGGHGGGRTCLRRRPNTFGM